ncbi:hypothetical protein QQ056_01065 [Oscillatoria laete-virens NRMC-F 0139]|nr:hypothetical protein [Oscillatoria laete-virens]MDL5052161.1 hypothetical protein [Oscillatoria laete-virens NRMC-F 0139]
MKKVFVIWGMVAAAAMLAFFVFRKQPTPTVSAPSVTPNTSAAAIDEVKTSAITQTTPQNEKPAVVEHAGKPGPSEPQKTKDGKALPASYTRFNPLVPANANMDVQSVVEAAKSGKNPERLSAIYAPEPFDRAAFDLDKAGYCRIVQPGRVWQSSDKPGASAIKMTGAAHRQMPAGGTLKLTAIAEPNSVISYYSQDLGAFENRLTSISVLTNERGEASATFTATPGTEGEVNILASCPESRGQLHL